ncbi:UNVERIFIED_CONTAM: hypothetical protein Sradi_3271800 [Sesamum radiatum]|uniref:Uncharacterized protein n=1 Tax=Sesamum radiatum TaxID=300843 RepID=A0AAW2R0X2_SESRA
MRQFDWLSIFVHVVLAKRSMGPGLDGFAGHAGVALGCQLRLRRSVPTWVSFHRQTGGCLLVIGAAMYLGMANSMRSWGRSLHGG